MVSTKEELLAEIFDEIEEWFESMGLPKPDRCIGCMLDAAFSEGLKYKEIE